jgi:hypothetical protein
MTCKQLPQEGQAFDPGLDHDFLAQRFYGKVAAIDTTDLRAPDSDDGVGLLRSGVLGAMLRLDILEGQLDLILADTLRAPTKLRTPQNRDDVIEALIPCRQPIDLGRENLLFMRRTLVVGIEPGTLDSCRQDHCLQRLDVDSA